MVEYKKAAVTIKMSYEFSQQAISDISERFDSEEKLKKYLEGVCVGHVGTPRVEVDLYYEVSLPKEFDIDLAIKALDDPKYLNPAFQWASTPEGQGFDYWFAEYERDSISDEARKIIESWIDLWKWKHPGASTILVDAGVEPSGAADPSFRTAECCYTCEFGKTSYEGVVDCKKHPDKSLFCSDICNAYCRSELKFKVYSEEYNG